jgi:hypothetical protein
LARVCVAAAVVLLAGVAQGQQAPVPPQDQAQQQQPKNAPPVEANRPGFIDAVGHWLDSSVNNWNSGLKGASDAAKDAAGVARDAAGVAGDAAKDAAKGAGNVVTDTAGAVARIPSTRVIAERTVCPVAPNGAPDCRLAAETVCRSHGFASGSSIDFQTVQKCPPVALNRPNDEPAVCVIESYVTRALCQ